MLIHIKLCNSFFFTGSHCAAQATLNLWFSCLSLQSARVACANTVSCIILNKWLPYKVSLSLAPFKMRKSIALSPLVITHDASVGSLINAFFLSAGDWTQGLVHGSQKFYHWAISTATDLTVYCYITISVVCLSVKTEMSYTMST